MILEGLLSRRLIRDPLSSRYGIGSSELEKLRRTPCSLQLRQEHSGPFQAGLSLLLAPGDQRRAWADLLNALRERLEQQGLSDAVSDPQKGSTTLPSSVWRREDGEVVGGWRWLSREGAAPELLLFLGPEPPADLDPGQTAGTPDGEWLHLELRPQRLAALGLMPSQLPEPLVQADQLTVMAESSGQGRPVVSSLRGRLQLTPPDQPEDPPPDQPLQQEP